MKIIYYLNQNMEQEYLSEQKYQDVKKGLVVLAVIVFLGSIICSYLFFLAPGLDKKKEAENYNIPTQQEVQDQKSAIEEKYDALEAEIEQKYDILEKEVENKYTKEMNEDGWFEESEIKANETIKLSRKEAKELTDLKTQKSIELLKVASLIPSAQLEKTKINNQSRMNLRSGGLVIFSGLILTGVILFVAFRRNVLAFKTQQVMPVAKEGIEKMSPTLGTVAKDITKGVKEGLEDKK